MVPERVKSVHPASPSDGQRRIQADGQTQTAAIFALHGTKDAIKKGALERYRVTLEIQLNVDERQAGQSLADWNDRG